MSKSDVKIQNYSSVVYKPGTVFSSNSIRLSACEWVFIGIVVLIMICFGPWLWERIEKFEPEPDYRIPYQYSYDYWFFSQYNRWAEKNHKVFVLGDSFIWGHYVSGDETLSAQLNKISGTGKFVNLGIDGIHPVALYGLLKYYGFDVSGGKVILHFNPLWISSEKHDLHTEKEFRFNHPRLVPQFYPKIPSYRANFARKITIIIERYVPFLNWISHLQIAYFNSTDLPTWTLEHPYKNPFGMLTLKSPNPLNDSIGENLSRINRGTPQQDLQWVELENSLQWEYFRQTIKLLQERGNKVFVMVGPFNEHILTSDSDEIYRQIKNGIESWLLQNNIPCLIPQTLPSELYADASHPLAEGYTILARQLFENPSFRTVIISLRDSTKSLTFAASN